MAHSAAHSCSVWPPQTVSRPGRHIHDVRLRPTRHLLAPTLAFFLPELSISAPAATSHARVSADAYMQALYWVCSQIECFEMPAYRDISWMDLPMN